MSAIETFWFVFWRPFADIRDFIAAIICSLPLFGFLFVKWGKALRNKARSIVGQTHLNET